MRIKPFQALRPLPEQAAQVASLPYDVINSEEARALSAGNPMSFLRIVKPEIDLPAGTDLYAEEVYAKAAENLRAFQENRYLIRDKDQALYLYRQGLGDHEQVGLVTVCHIEDYETDVIKKHERTLWKKENDRIRHVDILNANAGPVFLTYRDRPEVDRLVEGVVRDVPLFDFTASDHVRHTVWKITDTDPWISAFHSIPTAYVADGHHRSASAARVGWERRGANPDHTGAEEYNWFLCVLFPAHQLNILAYNRCVRDLNGLDPAQFLAAIRERFSIAETSSQRPVQARYISMYLSSRWYDVSWEKDSGLDPVASLDASILQHELLRPILGIEDPRQSPRIEFVGGIRGPEELVKRVDSGDHAVAFSLYPTRIEQLLDVADAGLMMPPKSTWFEPKLRSGLLVHTLD